MTNKDYIAKSLASMNISPDDIEIIMVKADINPDADVDCHACDLAIYNRFRWFSVR